MSGRSQRRPLSMVRKPICRDRPRSRTLLDMCLLDGRAGTGRNTTDGLIMNPDLWSRRRAALHQRNYRTILNVNVPEVSGDAPFICRTASDVASESVVLVLQGTSPDDHPGIVDGYERLRQAGAVSNLSVVPVYGPEGVARGDAFWRDVISRAHDQNATLVVFQFYHSDALPDPRSAVARMRSLPSRPSIVATLGDPFMNGYFGRPRIPQSFLQLASAADLIFLTSMGQLADTVCRFTRSPVVLLPLGACQVRFGTPPPIERLTPEPEFEVVFVGSRNRSRNPAKGFFWLGRRREELVRRLASRYGEGFAVFGHGWDDLRSAQGAVRFDQQVAAVQRAKVAVGGVPFSRAMYYASNRPFIQATSGVPVVDAAVPGVEKLLIDGDHWVLSDDASLIDKIDEVLSWPKQERRRIGRAGSAYVRSRHMDCHRVETLVENVRRLRMMRGRRECIDAYMPYFVDSVIASEERLTATRNWSQ